QEEYRRLAARLLKLSTLITVGLLMGEALLLSLLVRLVFPDYVGAEVPMMILTATFVFIVGFYPWLWAIFVGSGKLSGYTLVAFAGVGVQYAVALGLFHLIGPSATAAMAGMLAYYLWLIPAAYRLARREWGQFVLWGPRPVSAGERV
ncbi:MAG: hypothetical protein N2508_04745, partial [Anaerolineae bacterium]|nr:hypothetical protein [Anaerolineae bacterium]